MTNMQKRYAKERAKGKNKKDAALAAGYSPSTAKRTNMIETPNFREEFASIIRQYIPPVEIAKRLKKGIDAVETKFFQSEGVVTDSRTVINWAERRQYAALAAELGGYHVPTKSIDPNINIGFGIKIEFKRDPETPTVTFPERPALTTGA